MLIVCLAIVHCQFAFEARSLFGRSLIMTWGEGSSGRPKKFGVETAKSHF
jgi:hypothetical protein